MHTRTMFVATALALGLLAPVLAKAQDNFDIDRDGLISMGELEAALPDWTPGLRANFYKAKDENGDGFLTIAELADDKPVPMIMDAPPMVMAIMGPFDKADTDRNGLVTASELKAVGGDAQSLAFADSYVGGADADHDGGLSKAEWDANRPKVTRSSGG